MLENIPSNEKIVVGCSAGPDSMALLHYLQTNTNNKIICCHINHNVRKESIEEKNYLEKYCKDNNIIFEYMKINNYKENNFENEARKKRYAFYEKTLKKYQSKYLFLAHHGDDLIETILMKIARGSNLEGYAGIKEITNNNKDYNIIRPLLKYTKEDILNYLKENNIKYYIDKTNKDETYTRNRYRKNILPLLKKEDKNIHKKYLSYSKTLLEYQNYINDEINKYYNKIINNNKLNIKELKKLHPFLQKNILFKMINNYYNNESNIITNEHINNILKQINNSIPNITINLPKNILAIKNYNTLSIEKNNKFNKDYKILLKDNNIINNHIIEKKKEINTDGNDICRLNSKDLNLPLYIRNKKNGDFIEVKGLNGKKKISDIFIEKKIPQQERNKYPILVDNNNNILWIPNLKKSKFNKQKSDFCDIILRYCQKEEENEQ